MSTETFSFKDYSLSPVDLIPTDDDLDDAEDDELTVDQIIHDEIAKTLDVDDVMTVVGDAFSQTDLLRRLVEEIIGNPFRPGERFRLHVSDSVRMGETVTQLIQSAIDDAVGMRITIGGA